MAHHSAGSDPDGNDERRRLGAAIKAAREARGMTQTELGRLVGARQTAISAWEIGQNSPTGVDLVRLQRVLGTSFGGSADSPATLQRLNEAAGALHILAAMSRTMAKEAARAERAARGEPTRTEDGVEADERRESSDHHAALPPVVPHPTESRRRKGHR
jgi:transcriptional regulator with XRE-family HTH domain